VPPNSKKDISMPMIPMTISPEQKVERVLVMKVFLHPRLRRLNFLWIFLKLIK
jgi:hypothetical protein